MRTTLIALLLAGAAFAALPTASAAQELPVGCNAEVGACVWRNTPSGDCVGVHFGLQGAGACADADPLNVRVCSSMRTTVYEGNCPTDALWASVSLPILECDPDFVGVCYWTSPTGACAGANFGLQGAGACADAKEGVRVCTSMRTVLYDGFCPTDGTVLAELIALD